MKLCSVVYKCYILMIFILKFSTFKQFIFYACVFTQKRFKYNTKLLGTCILKIIVLLKFCYVSIMLLSYQFIYIIL